MARGADNREHLLAVAEAHMLDRGFGATSTEEIIAASRLSRSGFFYHFKDRNELARALVERYIAQDDALLDALFDRARELDDDPLHSFLIGLKLLSETMADLPGGHPGCLVTTFCYAERSFDRQVHALNRRAVLGWRERFVARLLEIAARYPLPAGTNVEALADAVGTTIEGGIILSRAAGRPALLAEQLLVLRSHVKLLFAGTATRAAPRRTVAPDAIDRAPPHAGPDRPEGARPRRVGNRRARLLDIAEEAVLTKGYAATSIEELAAEAGLTKGGFLYHFGDKGELARALLERAIERDGARLRAHFAARAGRRDDPLARLSTALERIATSSTGAGRLGSLVGTFCNTPGALDDRGRTLIGRALAATREPFAAALAETARRRPIGDDVRLGAVADRVFVALEGGIVMAKALAEPHVFAEQVRLVRSYLGLLFPRDAPAPSRPHPP